MSDRSKDTVKAGTEEKIHYTSVQQVINDDCALGKAGIFCPDGRSAVAAPGLNLVEKELAILFLDIKGFTCLLQSADPLQTVILVKKVLNLFERAITGSGGYIVDRAGDGLYAVYGLNTPAEQAADDSYLTAKMLRELLANVNERFFAGLSGPGLEIGIDLKISMF